MKKISPSFRRAYSTLINALELVRKKVHVSDPWHTLLKTAKTESLQPSPQWNIDATEEAKRHNQDMNRAEDYTLRLYGLNEVGSHRDWNEEYQQCKSMPMNTISDKVMRARALYKIEQDFKLASKNGAEAIMSGFVQPINPMDPPSSYVYVFNSIFLALVFQEQGEIRLRTLRERMVRMCQLEAKTLWTR